MTSRVAVLELCAVLTDQYRCAAMCGDQAFKLVSWPGDFDLIIQSKLYRRQHYPYRGRSLLGRNMHIPALAGLCAEVGTMLAPDYVESFAIIYSELATLQVSFSCYRLRDTRYPSRNRGEDPRTSILASSRSSHSRSVVT